MTTAASTHSRCHATSQRRPARLVETFVAGLLAVWAAGTVIGGSGNATAAACSSIDLVVARGTHEPGWLGLKVGDRLFADLQAAVTSSLTAYRVDYPADLLDPFSVGDGSRDLVAHLTAQATACPDQRFVLAGYSQGAVVVHAALGTWPATLVPGAAQLPPDLGDRVAVVLLFGDPLRLIGQSVPEPYSARTGSWCLDGDPVCQPGGREPPAHIAYSSHLTEAAAFTTDHL
ncbi:cutinase family protein [Nocardia transvalensis]|uniref:cutinase family protein n=1 Tax=Nocardia transvalensis TaxID=37333 RepID=UPI001894D0EC|nr:cutinase family protein [Nocardia transvalensis]MBF6333539.1 cutinase family protein [Nocardia transvalensis]